jgi:hypothetical protein
LRDQLRLFGEVASDSTAYRVIERIACDPALIEGLRAAHAKARACAWQRGVKPQRGDDRAGRDARHRALGQGRRGRQLQGRLRLSPAAGVPR